MSTKPQVFSHTRQRSLNAVEADLPALWPSFGATNRSRSARIDQERSLDGCPTSNTNRQPCIGEELLAVCRVATAGSTPQSRSRDGSSIRVRVPRSPDRQSEAPARRTLLLAVAAGLGATRGLRLLATRCVDRKEEA
jgi:hypothetical protein